MDAIGCDDKFIKWLKHTNHIVYRRFIEIDPEYVNVREMADQYFAATQAQVVIPLVLNERLLGVIHLDKKANLSRYYAADFQFLTTIRNQSAIAISNSLIYQNIEEQVKERTEELVDMQKQLVQAEKLATVGTLSGGVAHEINNPLAAILANVQMMLMFADEGEEVQVEKESLQMIEEATQRCRVIVQKLMDYAKKPVEDKETHTVDMLALLNKVKKFLGYQLEQDDISIDISAQDEVCNVIGNANELEQVITNIILNARDAMVDINTKGNISVVLDKVVDRIRLQIKDQGKGMTKDVQNQIFDPFFTTKDVGKGLGLGLSICHSIVQKHHGDIQVQSQLGEGTEFTIILPQQ